VREKVCIGGALCAEICPHDAIQMTEAAECKRTHRRRHLEQFYIRNANEETHVGTGPA